MKNFCSFCILICMANIFIINSAFAGEKAFGGSIGTEVWYSAWECENQWDKVGVNLDYNIEPAFIYGYSTSFNFVKDKKLITGVALDMLTSAMEYETNENAFAGNSHDQGAYRKIRANICQNIGENGYFHIAIMHGKFEGEVRVENGGSALGVPDGTSWDLETEWFKADVMFMGGSKEGMAGIGFRYISYSKPETTSIFVATGSEEGLMVSGDLISGEVVETKFDGYYLVLGIWDNSFIGLPTDSWLFYDFKAFLGVAKIKNELIDKSDGFGGGIEGALGIKYSYRISKNSWITAKLGYRALYNKMSVSDKITEDENGNEVFRISETIDLWHGPFFGINLYF